MKLKSVPPQSGHESQFFGRGSILLAACKTNLQLSHSMYPSNPRCILVLFLHASFHKVIWYERIEVNTQFASLVIGQFTIEVGVTNTVERVLSVLPRFSFGS